MFGFTTRNKNVRLPHEKFKNLGLSCGIFYNNKNKSYFQQLNTNNIHSKLSR